MEPKKISCDQSPSLSTTTRYQSFIAQKLESYKQLCKINELRGRHFRACFHGWVILSNHDNVLWSLWNPLTSKLICLPPLHCKKNDFYECCLSSPPDDQGSVLLLAKPKIPTFVFCRLNCKRKKLKWIEMSYAKQLRRISGVDCLLYCITCCNGKMYAVTVDSMAYEFVIQVDIVVKGKEVVINLLPVVKLPHAPTFSFQSICVFLKGTCTELFFIELYLNSRTRIADVYLFKLDMTSMIWEEMEDLKDAIFFLEFSCGNASSVFYKSEIGLEIGGYVHILNEFGRIISFHVKDRIMSLCSKSCIVREGHMLVWTMLESRLEVDHPESKQQKEEGKDNEIVITPRNGDDDTEFYSTTSESHLLNIPFNILEVIMDLCVGVEYMNFRATCKRCKLAAPLIKWSKTTLRRLDMYSLVSPWLVVLEKRRSIFTFIDPTSGGKYFIKAPQELISDGCEIYCSRYGWLLMYEVNGHMAFFNPFTNDIRELPVARFLQSLCFSAPPTSQDCVVVGFRKLDSDVYVHLVSQDSSWRKYRFDFGSNDPYSFQSPTFCGRDVYVLFNKERIEAFRVSEEDLSRVVVVDKAPRGCYESTRRYFLTNIDRHLLLVMVSWSGKHVDVFKLNESTKEFEQVDGLGKHTIYISDISCICLEAKSQEMENKIYFSRLLRNKDAKIVFYSFETCKYHTYDDKYIQESFGADLLKTMHYCDSHTWIEPSWS